MLVRLEFPSVMKMEMVMLIEDAENTSLRDVQKRAFCYFWDCYSSFRKHIKEHGSFGHVELWDRMTWINTEEKWQQCATAQKTLSVLFDTTVHPHVREKYFETLSPLRRSE